MDNIFINPESQKNLFIKDNKLIDENGYIFSDFNYHQIIKAFYSDESIGEKTTKNVKEFYEETPFPDYNNFDDLSDFIERSKKGIFANTLVKSLPQNIKIAEFGSGTSQLSNFIAASTMNEVYACDMTENSLKLGLDFAIKNKIRGIRFVQTNIFYPCFKKNSFDLIISNGVLHHTKDPYLSFQKLIDLLKPGGYVLIGLYNKKGRLKTDLIRLLYRIFGLKIVELFDDAYKNMKSESKKKSWVNDQYNHPSEKKYSYNDLYSWFNKNDVKFLNSIPRLEKELLEDENILNYREKYSKLSAFNTEIKMMLNNYEGGLYIFIGKKNEIL